MARILLIDDDNDVHMLLSLFLKMKFGDDSQLTSAATLDAAVGHLTDSSFDAIFLDNRLKPYPDFRETVPVLRGLAGAAPMHVISASIDDPYFKEASAFGINSVLDKSMLHQAVHDLIASAQAKVA